MSDLRRENADALAALVPDGAKVAITKNNSGVPAELARALVRRGARDLHLVCVPTAGYAADLLIGAGCVATVETSAVTLDETGLAPRFQAAIREGSVRLMDSTCPAVYAGLRAGEKAIPFIPIRGLIGSDIVAHRPDYKVIDNPYAENDPILVVPAINPDVALLHAPMADSEGNVFAGADRDLPLIAHAARTTLVTVERYFEGNLLDDDATAASTISSVYIGAIARAEAGAWPHPLRRHYKEDLAHMALYHRQAQTAEGFAAYLEAHVLDRRVAAE